MGATPGRQSPGRSRRLVAVAALLLVLGGCTALSLGWRFIDGVLVERVDDWVALTPSQRARLQQRLDPWLARIATERFPDYIRFLREAAARTREGIEPADGPWAYQRARTLYRALQADALESWIAPALTDLEAGQLRHLRQRMRGENAEYRERYLAVTRRQSRRALADRIIDVVDDWTGPLDLEQTQLVYRGVRQLPDTSREWYHYRLRKQAGLLSLLRSDPEPDAVADYLGGWWIDRRGLPVRDRARFGAFQEQLVAVLTELTRALDAEQRAAVNRRLRTLADELEAIRREVVAGD